MNEQMTECKGLEREHYDVDAMQVDFDLLGELQLEALCLHWLQRAVRH